MGKEQNTDEKISIMDAFTVSPLAEMLKLNLSDCMALFKVGLPDKSKLRLENNEK